MLREHWFITYLRSTNVLCDDVLSLINKAIYENTGWSTKSKIIEAQLRKVKAVKIGEDKSFTYGCKFQLILTSYRFSLEDLIKDGLKLSGRDKYTDENGNIMERRPTLYADGVPFYVKPYVF